MFEGHVAVSCRYLISAIPKQPYYVASGVDESTYPDPYVIVARKRGRMRMTSEQKIVAIGAASGVALMVASVWLLTMMLPNPRIGEDVGARLAYALRANVFSLIPFF